MTERLRKYGFPEYEDETEKDMRTLTGDELRQALRKNSAELRTMALQELSEEALGHEKTQTTIRSAFAAIEKLRMALQQDLTPRICMDPVAEESRKLEEAIRNLLDEGKTIEDIERQYDYFGKKPTDAGLDLVTMQTMTHLMQEDWQVMKQAAGIEQKPGRKEAPQRDLEPTPQVAPGVAVRRGLAPSS